MRGRDVLIGMGVLAAAAGLTAIVAPGVLGLSMDSLTVTVLGGVMLLYALAAVSDADPGLDQARTGDPERRRGMPRPGDRIDAMMARFDGENAGPIQYRRRVREWVVEAAVSVIAHTEGVDEAAARERIEEQVYADYRELEVIADLDGERDEGRVPVRERIRALTRRDEEEEAPLQEKVRRAVNALATRLDVASVDAEDGYPDDVSELRERVEPPTREEAGALTDERGLVEVADGVYRRSRRETGHWTGMVALAFAFGGAGVVTGRSPLLLVGAVGIGFAAYARSASSARAPLAVERELSPEDPDDGEETVVTLTVRNEGDRVLPDLRVVDGVPERLAVASGVPRIGTALRPGEEATVEYAVTATRGAHEFGPLLAISRDASGAIEDELVVAEETTLACTPTLQDVETTPRLRDLATGFVGGVAARRGGGVEFYAVREYRPGDPPSRIDWSRHARTGELATLQFREERSTTVVLVVDTRRDAYVAPDDGDHAVDRSVEAAGRLFSVLNETSNRVGLANFGPDQCWLPPGTGRQQAHRAERLLGTHRAFSPLPPPHRNPTLTWIRDLRSRLPEESQVVFLTPLCDDFAAFVARRLDAFGHPVTVLSPDPTGGPTVGGRLARIRRTLRVQDLRRTGVPVVDWDWEHSLEAVLRQEATGREA